MKIKIVTILFENGISPLEIPFFRGSAILIAEGNSFFHNHTDYGFAYSYPLIQYKIIRGCAAIVGIKEAAGLLECLFPVSASFPARWGNRNLAMRVASVRTEICDVDATDRQFLYRIDSWLPFNRKNYIGFRASESVQERLRMLENILTGNILSFAKGMGMFFENRVECHISELEETGPVSFKGVDLISFSAVFSANILLPESIGLGKSTSLNHGTVRPL